MPDFTKILVGLDLGSHGRELTPGSRLAADQAGWLAPRCDASVTLFQSSASDESWDVGSGGYVVVHQGVSEEGRAALEAAAETLRAEGIETDIAQTEERAAIGIARAVITHDYDLVILGKRTHAPKDTRKLGSVSLDVVRNVPCDVWVVKIEADLVAKTILAATDLTDVGARVLRHAGAIAAACEAELHVVHAFPMPMAVQMSGPEEEDSYIAETREEVSAKIRAQLDDTALGSATAHLHVGCTSPTRAILECVDRIAPQLIVMGTISRGGIAGLVMGNTAERLMGKLDESILTVKPADFVYPFPDRLR